MVIYGHYTDIYWKLVKNAECNFLCVHVVSFEVEPFKSQSPVDPRTVTEQFDVNQQASAVGLYCFWFACDHANPLLLMSFFSL